MSFSDTPCELPRPTLSVVMIVRDEAAILPRFLEAGDGLWDELAVMDTGSLDDTVSLLREAGAKLAHMEWPGNFAVARNAALELATGDWVLVLDADEIVSPEFVAEIRTLISRPDLGAATVTMRNLFTNGHHRDSRLLRLFRRDPGLRYEHAIHEEVAGSVGAMLARTGRGLGHISAPVQHVGYLKDRASEKAKLDRDRGILEQLISEDPSDTYSRFKLLELARFWGEQELGVSASQSALTALRDGSLSIEDSHVGGELIVTLARFLAPQDAESALSLYDEFEATTLPSAAWHFGRGALREQVGKLEEAEADFRACLAAEDPLLQMVTTRPLMGLARLRLAQADLPGAMGLVDQALEHSPSDAEALLAALSFRLEDPAAVGEFLEGRAWTPAVAAALESAVEMSAISFLRKGLVLEAHARLAQYVGLKSSLGLGMLACDLILGRSSDLDLDISLEDANRSLRRWLVHLMGIGRPELVAAFAQNAPSVLGTFPWLRETLGLKH